MTENIIRTKCLLGLDLTEQDSCNSSHQNIERHGMLTSHAFFLYSLFLLQAFADESTVDQVTLSKNGTAASGNAGKERAFGCVSINFQN